MSAVKTNVEIPVDANAVKAIRRYNCICGKPACQQLREAVYTLKDTFGSEAKLTEGESDAAGIRVALIHWPPQLLVDINFRTTAFKSRKDASKADKKYFPGRTGNFFADDVNRMDFLLAHVDAPEKTRAKWKNVFVQAPIFTSSMVEDEILEYKRHLSQSTKLSTPRISPTALVSTTPIPNDKVLSSINSLGAQLGDNTPTDTGTSLDMIVSTYNVDNNTREAVGCLTFDTSFISRTHDELPSTTNCMNRPMHVKTPSMDNDYHNETKMAAQVTDGIVLDLLDAVVNDAVDGVVDDTAVDDAAVDGAMDVIVNDRDKMVFDIVNSVDHDAMDDMEDDVSNNGIDDLNDVVEMVDAGVDEAVDQLYIDSAASIQIHQSLTTTQLVIRNYCVSTNDDDDKLRNDDNFIATLNHLHYSLKRSQVVISKKKVMILCDNFVAINCSKFMFRIYERRKQQRYLCSNCRKEHEANEKKEARKQKSLEDGTNRTGHDSHTPITALSPESIKRRFRSVAKENNRLKTNLRRWRLRLDLTSEQKTMVVHEEEEGLTAVLTLACKECVESKEKFIQNTIETLLSTLFVQRDAASANDKRKIKKYAELIASTLKNYLTMLEGKPRQVRFHRKVIRTALAAWLSSPSNYNVLRENSIEILPSASHLSKIQKDLVTQEGECARVYQWFKEDRCLTTAGKLTGVVTFDEMHLTADLACNMKNHQTYGFASSNGKGNGLDFATELKNLYEESLADLGSVEDDNDDDDDDDDANESCIIDEAMKSYEKIADNAIRKMNLFRVKLNNGHSGNVEYWFNAGSLTAEDLIGQLLRVVLHFEMIGIEIHMICSDAGGGNTGLFNALRTSRLAVTSTASDNVWSFWNPYDPKRKVFIVPCSVHGLKAMRNSMLNSMPSGSRSFRFESASFGWKQKQALLEVDKPPQRQSDLTPQVINPDGCSKMCVKDALAPFTYKTITFEINNCVRDLNKNDQESFHTERDHYYLQNEDRVGYEAETLDFLLSVLKTTVDNGNYDANSHPEIKSKLMSLEYSVAVHGIFVARMLNYHCFIVLELRKGQEKRSSKKKMFFVKLEAEIARMKWYDAKLLKWWKFVQQCKQKKDPLWKKYCPSVATIKNLRQTMWGFMGYVQTMLTETRLGIKYIPYHLANQSSIEMQFSMLRGANRNKAADIPKGLLAISMSATLDAKRLDNGKAYSGEMVQETEIHVDGAEHLLHRRDKKRELEWMKWISNRRSILTQRLNYPSRSTLNHHSVDVRCNDERFKFWKQKLIWDGSSSEMLANNEKFVETAKTSIFEDTSHFFQSLFNLSSVDEELSLDRFCYAVYDKVLWLLLYQSKQLEALFFKFLISDEFTKLAGNIVPKLSHRGCLAVVANSLKTMLVEQVITIIQTSSQHKIDFVALSVQQSDPDFKIETKFYVNRFIGYGLYCLIAKEAEKVDNCDASSEDGNVVTVELDFYKSLRVQTTDVLFLEDYRQHWYDDVFLLQNKGMLALLSPDYLEFGYAVMEVIRNKMTVVRMRTLGNNSLRSMTDDVILCNDSFYQAFDLCYANRKHNQELQVEATVRRNVVDTIVSKASHSYYASVLKYMKEQLTKRGGKSYKPNNFRQDLASKNDVKRAKIVTDEVAIGR